MGDSHMEKTGFTYNNEIEIDSTSSTIQILNAIENSPNIECISYSSLYGFVFRVQLAEINRNNGFFKIINSHNKINIPEKPIGINPTHIILKITVLVDNNFNIKLDDCINVYTGEKYTKHTNTMKQFDDEVLNQKNIYNKTLGPNGIAICPKIFYNVKYENTDAIEFLEFFDKNVSDVTSTYLVNYLLFTLRTKLYHDGNKKTNLGLIAMEYIQIGDNEKNATGIELRRDDRISLYSFLTTPQKSLSGKGSIIVEKLIQALPTLKINPYLFHKTSENASTKRKIRGQTSPQQTEIDLKDLKTNYVNSTNDELQNQQLEFLRLNYYKYRIIAQVIYYMLRAYNAGYIHNDLHSNNIFVINPYIKYHGCLHPFSLNDVGIAQSDENTQMLQRNYFTGDANVTNNDCGNINNYCNLSCIEIIDWGRTLSIENQHIQSEDNITLVDVIKMINDLKSKYKHDFYIFNNVGLKNNLDTDPNQLSYPQFYIVWLIWNEFYRMNIYKINKNLLTQENTNTVQDLKNDSDFYNFLTLFKTNCEFNTFYETIAYS